MPGVVQAGTDQLLREQRQVPAIVPGRCHAIPVLRQYRPGLQAEIILRIRRVCVSLAREIPQHLPLVFLEQAVRVIFGMPLEKYQAQPVLADSQVHPDLVALSQHLQAGRSELLRRHRIETGVRHIKAGIHAGHQGVRTVHDPV